MLNSALSGALGSPNPTGVDPIAEMIANALQSVPQAQPDIYQQHVNDAQAAYQNVLGQQGMQTAVAPQHAIRNKKEALIAAGAALLGNLIDSHHTAGTQAVQGFLGTRNDLAQQDYQKQLQQQQLDAQQLQGKIQSAQVGLQGAMNAQQGNDADKRRADDLQYKKDALAQGNVYKDQVAIDRLTKRIVDPLVDDVTTRQAAMQIAKLDPTAAYTPEQLDALIAGKATKRTETQRKSDAPTIDKFITAANNPALEGPNRLIAAQQALAFKKKYPDDPQLLAIEAALPQLQKQSQAEKLVATRFQKAGLDIKQEQQSISLLAKKLENYDDDHKLQRVNIESQIRARNAASQRAAAKSGKAPDFTPKTADINALIHVNNSQINRLISKAMDPVTRVPDYTRLSSDETARLKSLQEEVDQWKSVLQTKLAPPKQTVGQGTLKGPVGGGYQKTSSGVKFKIVG